MPPSCIAPTNSTTSQVLPADNRFARFVLLLTSPEVDVTPPPARGRETAPSFHPHCAASVQGWAGPLCGRRDVTGGRGRPGAGPPERPKSRPKLLASRREAAAAPPQRREDGAAGVGTGAEERRVAE